PPGAVGSFSAPGDQLNRPSRSVTDRSVLFFLLARLHRNQSLKLTIQHLDFYQYSSLVDKLPCLSSIMGVRYATSKIFVVLLHWLLALYVRPYFNHVFFVYNVQINGHIIFDIPASIKSLKTYLTGRRNTFHH